jgi:hypothetical protein
MPDEWRWMVTYFGINFFYFDNLFCNDWRSWVGYMQIGMWPLKKYLSYQGEAHLHVCTLIHVNTHVTCELRPHHNL